MNTQGVRYALAAHLVFVQVTFAGETLNEQNLSLFAQTWTPVTTRLMETDAEFDPSHLTGLVGQLKAMADSDGEASALDKAVEPDGYADFETWSDLARRAIVSVQWANSPPSREKLDQAIAAIKADGDIEQNQKESLVIDLAEAFDKALAQKPPAADIAAAKAMLPLFEQILTSGE